jgi:hypothetical protein
MRVCINEAGRDCLTGCDHFSRGGESAKLSNRGNAVTGYRDISLEARRAGTVKHRCITYDHVTTQRHGDLPRG